MNKETKLLAISMATMVFATSLMSTGCGKKDDSVVQADAPWYDLQKVTIGEQYNEDGDIASFNISYIGKAGDMLLFASSGRYRNRQETDNLVAAKYANGEPDCYSDRSSEEYLDSTSELSNQLIVDL